MGKSIFGGKGAVGAPYRVANHSGLYLSGSLTLHARVGIMGICREVWFQGNLMRYMWPGSGLLEPALTLVNGLAKNRVGFREKIELKVNSLSIEKSAYMGVWSEIRAAPCGRPGERTFRDKPSPF